MSGAQKAATLLLAMGQDTASRILRHLDANDVREITRAAATLGVVDFQLLETLIEQCEQELEAGPTIIGDIARAEQLGAALLPPEEMTHIIASVEGVPKVDVLAELQRLSKDDILRLIEKDPTYIACVVLSKLEPALAAQVCDEMVEPFRTQILSGILNLRPMTPFASKCFENALGSALAAVKGRQTSLNRETRVANIINRMHPSAVDAVVASLSKASPSEMAAVRALIFKFEDITLLGKDARVTLLDQVPTESVILALKGADQEVARSVISCLGARARRMVEAELSNAVSTAPRETAMAQRSIADLALRLAEAGVIDIGGQRSGRQGD
jgi:flagellar motor switch protein FliG